jgi:hypothetical protein
VARGTCGFNHAAFLVLAVVVDFSPPPRPSTAARRAGVCSPLLNISIVGSAFAHTIGEDSMDQFERATKILNSAWCDCAADRQAVVERYNLALHRARMT